MDARYAYISTEMDGFIGNILAVYDIADPRRRRRSRAGGCRASISLPARRRAGQASGTAASCAALWRRALGELLARRFFVVDCADIARPRTLGSCNYHPPFPEPTHTVMPVPAGSRTSASRLDRRGGSGAEHERGACAARTPACGICTFDVSDPRSIKPLGLFEVSERDSPFARVEGARSARINSMRR